MHDKLFANPKEISKGQLERHIAELKLNPKAFQACLETTSVGQVVRDIESGRALSVTGTPTFFVGRRQADGRVRLVERIPGSVQIERWQMILTKWLAD